MRPLSTVIFFLFVLAQSQAQQDSLAQLHRPYQTAMGLLKNLQNTLLQDSVAIAQEWQRLNNDYKRLADSLQNHSNAKTAIHFEAQRLIDAINYRRNDAKLQENRNTLYRFVNQHQAALLENNTQFNKIAQCLMGIAPEGETNETKLIKYNACVIQDFYTQLDTAKWSEQAHQQFITAFATAYLKVGSVRKAEKLFRNFDTLFVSSLSRKREHIKPLKTFSLPDSIHFKDGKFMTNGLIWSALEKKKIIINLSSEPQIFDFVYLVATLRTIHDNYADVYDVVILHNSEKLYDQYLSSIKGNLAFSDYNIATIPAEQWSNFSELPAVLVLNAQNEVTDQANHTNPLFKKLHLPIETKKEQEVAAYWADIAKKKDSIAQRATQTKDSISYVATHEKITFVLKGLWGKDLATQLSPVQLSATDTEPSSAAERRGSTKKPYLAQFEVKHPQYPVYQLLVLVTGKQQEITITSGFPNAKIVCYAKTENAAFYEALQTIVQTQAQAASYEYILKNYPFQNTAFVSYVHEALEQAKEKEQQAIESVKKAKNVLERYADEKREQMQAMR